MSTVAANRECMAADSKVTIGSTHYSTVKIERIGQVLVGCAGHTRAIARFLTWMRKGGGRKPSIVKTDQLEAIILSPSGLFRVDRACEFDEVKDAFTAVGSGDMAALAAMHCGLAPGPAVGIACRVDNHSAPPVDVFYLYASEAP